MVIADAHGGAHTLAISPDARLLASGSWSGRIGIWSLPGGKRLNTWQGHDGNVNGLVFLSSGRLLSAGRDGNLVEWASNGERLRAAETASPITAMTVDDTQRMVLTGHADGGLRLRSLSDLSVAETIGRHLGSVRAAAIAPDGSFFASSATDGKVILWQANGDFRELPQPGSDARTLVFSPDGLQLYGGGWFDLFRWNLQPVQLLTLDTEHFGIINSLQFDPKGRYLASISRQTDSSVLFLDPDTGTTITRFQSHELCGGTVVISPDGQIMATTSDDASMMIWRLGDHRRAGNEEANK